MEETEMNKKEKSYKIVTIGSYIIAVMFYAAAALALMGENTIMGMFYLALGSLSGIVGLVSGLKNKKAR
jgi:Na+/proline symporter